MSDRELHPKERRAVVKATGEKVIVYRLTEPPDTWADGDRMTENITYKSSELIFPNEP